MAAAQVDDGEISGINVTPLVDVVLVLLVIFMITAPALYQNAMQVQLPKAQSGDGQAKQTLEIYIDKQGSIVIEKKQIKLDDLKKLILSTKPTGAMILADTKAEHGQVIQVIDLLKSNGVQKFSFGVEK